MQVPFMMLSIPHAPSVLMQVDAQEPQTEQMSLLKSYGVQTFRLEDG